MVLTSFPVPLPFALSDNISLAYFHDELSLSSRYSHHVTRNISWSKTWSSLAGSVVSVCRILASSSLKAAALFWR